MIRRLGLDLTGLPPTLTETDYGRDHHPRCFTVWLAGGGIKPGQTHGETDDFSYNIVRDPVEVYDLNATILHLLGIGPTRLTYKFQGRDIRLTDVHAGLFKRSWPERSLRRSARCPVPPAG